MSVKLWRLGDTGSGRSATPSAFCELISHRTRYQIVARVSRPHGLLLFLSLIDARHTPRLPFVTGSPIGPPPGWYPDPAGGQTIRWWDGNGWTGHQAPTVSGIPGIGPGTHQPNPKRVLPLTVIAGLTLVSIPVNWFTIDWGQKAAQNSTQCNAALTWDQAVLGFYLPLFFVALALGCLTAGIVIRVRTRRAERPLGSGVILLSVIGFVFSFGSGFLAAFSVGSINWCF